MKYLLRFLASSAPGSGFLLGLLTLASACAESPAADDLVVPPGGFRQDSGAVVATTGGTGGLSGTAGGLSGTAGGVSGTAGGLSGTAGGLSGTAGGPGGAAGGTTGGIMAGAVDGGVPRDSGMPRDGGAAAGGTTGGSPDAGAAGGGELFPLTAPLPSGMAYGAGWTWVDVPGAKCRDGSGAGYYWRRGKEAPLMIFMNGGGACSDPFFCGLNPVNVNQDLPTQSLIDATGNVLLGPDGNRQMPPDEGVFKKDPRNPVANWNMIYMPYCTGDVFAGNKPDGTVPGVEGKQQFVGYKNVGLFLDSFGPSFASAGKVLLTGSSAGGFATLLNYDRVQTFFDKYSARVYGVTDSGIPFRDTQLAPCLQKRWRELWNLNDTLPKDCTGCFRADGGGLTEGLGTYLFKEKYKDRVLGGMISAAEDGVIRAFYGPGLGDCTNDPGANAIFSAFNLGAYSGETFRAGLRDVIGFIGKDKIHSYILPSWEHMHLWRARYYEAVNGVTIAQWLGNIVNDKPAQAVGAP